MNRRWLSLLLALTICLTACLTTDALGDAAPAWPLTGLTTDKLATRSGPGTQYSDTGVYKVQG